MKYTFTILFFLTMICAKGQQTDSLQKAHAKYLSKELAISDFTANQVVVIMDNYKQNAKKALNNKALKPEEVKAKMDLLIDEKNKQLALLLNEQQLRKIIPTSERPNDKTDKSNNHK